MTMQRTLDRQVHFDERSRAFSVADVVTRPPRSYTWRVPIVLDQGTEGACVGFSITHEIASRPVEVLGLTAADALRLYHEAQKVDDQPGENYSGTSVHAGIKTAVAWGFYSRYHWAFNVDDLASAVSWLGPAVLGIPWYESMFQPGSDGFVRVSGAVAGGHAILTNGFSVPRDAFRLHNSWGPTWGQKGEAWISKADLTRLLSEQGEACIPITRLRGRVA